MHGPSVGGDAQIQCAHERRKIFERQASAQVSAAQSGFTGHFSSHFLFCRAAKKQRQDAFRCQTPHQPCPKIDVWPFGRFTRAKHQPNAPRTGSLCPRVCYPRQVGVCEKIQQVQVSPVECIVPVVLRQGGPVQLPVAANMLIARLSAGRSLWMLQKKSPFSPRARIGRRTLVAIQDDRGFVAFRRRTCLKPQKENATSLRRWRFGAKTLAMTYSCMA